MTESFLLGGSVFGALGGLLNAINQNNAIRSQRKSMLQAIDEYKTKSYLSDEEIKKQAWESARLTAPALTGTTTTQGLVNQREARTLALMQRDDIVRKAYADALQQLKQRNTMVLYAVAQMMQKVPGKPASDLMAGLEGLMSGSIGGLQAGGTSLMNYNIMKKYLNI